MATNIIAPTTEPVDLNTIGKSISVRGVDVVLGGNRCRRTHLHHRAFRIREVHRAPHTPHAIFSQPKSERLRTFLNDVL